MIYSTHITQHKTGIFFTPASRCPTEQWNDTSISNGEHN